MKQYQIWSEGYIATGQSSGAFIIATSEGETFKDACDNFAKKDNKFNKYYNPERMTCWGCKLFDNEIDARKSFG